MHCKAVNVKVSKGEEFLPLTVLFAWSNVIFEFSLFSCMLSLVVRCAVTCQVLLCKRCYPLRSVQEAMSEESCGELMLLSTPFGAEIH